MIRIFMVDITDGTYTATLTDRSKTRVIKLPTDKILSTPTVKGSRILDYTPAIKNGSWWFSIAEEK